MGAAVKHHMDLAVTVTAHDYRLASNCRRDVIAIIRDLAVMTDKQPDAAKNALHLDVEDFRVDIEVLMDPVGLHEAANSVGVI